MNKLYKLSVLMLLVLSSALFAQSYKVTGAVKSSAGEALIGANVYVLGTTTGAATDENGNYELSLRAGDYTIVCSYIGFETKKEDVSLTNNMELNFSLRDKAFSLSVEVIADRAKERETPVAFSTIEKKEMEQKLGSQDIPMVLNTTPSIYATNTGGGAGDARISLRGFNQRNFSIMINGVPVNDMENGWVYWSNWDGLGDATSSIQVQRGLSAVNLATPSIGGTLNIITDPIANKGGISLKQAIGNDSFYKTTLSFNSGLIDEKFAINATLVRKSGEGYVDATWTDAYSYYVGGAYNVNDNNRIEFYAMGAPQRHGQNSYRQNVAAYSHELATDLGYSQEALDKFPEEGRRWNETWNNVSPSYGGLQAWNENWFTATSGLQPRYASDFLNERENFFHKPIVNFNWFSKLNDKMSLYTTLYWSGGIGGGTGTYGSLKWDYNHPSRIIDFDATIARNVNDNVDANGLYSSTGILRNSRNDQSSWGALAKMLYKVSDNFTMQVGLDWRTAEIDHYREVRDLLGGDYYTQYSSDFWGPDGKNLVEGDKFNYYTTNTVDWLGAYVQGELTAQRFSVTGMVGWSMTKYGHTNHFMDDGSGVATQIETDNISGIQFKGGASYRINADVDAFVNAGYVQKVPTLDQAIDDVNSVLVDDPGAETFMDFEAGLNFRALDGRLVVKSNVYYTQWNDRFNTRNIQMPNGDEGVINLLGMDQTHMGVELEAAYQPIDMLRLDATVSIGIWDYVDDVAGTFVDYQDGGVVTTNFNYYLTDIKVGDQPQQQFVFTASLFPVDGLYISGTLRHYREFYADFDPLDRTDETDRTQSYQLPEYTIVDLHMSYDLPFKIGNTDIQIFGHIFNLLDALYIQDATDNSSYNAFTANGKDHSADDMEVFLGLPTTFNAGIKIRL